MFVCNSRSMKLPLSRGFMSTYASATNTANASVSTSASVSVSSSTPEYASLCASAFVSAPKLVKPANCYTMCESSDIKMLPRTHLCSNVLLSQQQQRFERCDAHSSRKCGSGISNFTQCLLICGVLLLLAAGNAIVEGALRNVNLIIEPPAVRRGQHAIVRCLYDLEGTPLYSAKFYRGQLEFYRYTPGEFPNTKVFPFPGIHVDVTNSNATQVLIRNVGFGLSGNFSCEVTADAPLFSTATATGIMQVVELPEKRPQLFTEHARYEPGDILRANCSTPPSRPRAELKFTINNMVVANVETQYIRTIDNLMASRISLKLQLQGIHFSNANPLLLHNGGHGYGGYNSNSGSSSNNGYGMNSLHSFGGGGGNIAGSNSGSLVLRCTAQIGDLYQEYKEIELGTPQKDPVPARVTLSSGSSMTNFFSSYFSSSSRKFPPPTATAMILMAIMSIAATTSITKTASALTVQIITIIGLIVDLRMATFSFFERLMKCKQKLNENYTEKEPQQQKNKKQINQELLKQKQQFNKKETHKYENPCKNKRDNCWRHLLPSQMPLMQSDAWQQQQQNMHSNCTSYLMVNALALTNR
ncbi:uncharacterized protein [Eurosta solidaginis]|uniref:uncharacterized protein n=1 Tax=Eurosta solidaginis TaxID=178769 RepID=UPI003530AD96